MERRHFVPNDVPILIIHHHVGLQFPDLIPAFIKSIDGYHHHHHHHHHHVGLQFPDLLPAFIKSIDGYRCWFYYKYSNDSRFSLPTSHIFPSNSRRTLVHCPCWRPEMALLPTSWKCWKCWKCWKTIPSSIIPAENPWKITICNG